MPRIQPVEKGQADPKARELLDGVEGMIGFAPNIFRTFAHSPAVLEAYLGLKKTLAGASLSAAQQESIALATAGANGCDYCAAAHTAGGKRAGLDADELAANLEARSSDPKTQALIALARAVVDKRGWIGDEGVAAAREAGLNDAEIVETVAITAMNIFTNYFNHIAGTEVDFPAVSLPAAAAAE